MRNPWLAIGVWLALASACGEAPPADIAVERPMPGATPALDVSLARMEAALDTAIEAGLDGGGIERLYRVEEISNRLLESQAPFAWLGETGYSVDARLRQIQSVADRIVALVRGGGRREDLLADVESLRGEIQSLRGGLARGGTVAPVPVERLLMTLDTTRR